MAECDNAGIWEIDFEFLTLRTGVSVTLESFLEFCNFEKERFRKIGNDKLWMVDFPKFQYGVLKPSSPPHRSVIARLVSLGLYPNGYPNEGVTDSPQEKEEDKDKDKDKEKAKEKEEDLRLQKIEDHATEVYHETLEAFRPSLPALADVVSEWGTTLKHFSINKDPNLDAVAIAGLVKRHGKEKSILAIRGMRFQPKTQTFDPANYVAISRLMSKATVFESCVNLGAQDRSAGAVKPQGDYSFLAGVK